MLSRTVFSSTSGGVIPPPVALERYNFNTQNDRLQSVNFASRLVNGEGTYARFKDARPFASVLLLRRNRVVDVRALEYGAVGPVGIAGTRSLLACSALRNRQS